MPREPPSTSFLVETSRGRVDVLAYTCGVNQAEIRRPWVVFSCALSEDIGEVLCACSKFSKS
jgi:hypothetical protein